MIGSKYQSTLTVTEHHTAETAGSGSLPVLGTPFMIALMENAAMKCLEPFLEEGQGSVGTHMDVTHDAPTPIGMDIRAEAEITAASTNGKMITFSVKAWDETGQIGQGVHTRAVINGERFLAKTNAKLARE